MSNLNIRENRSIIEMLPVALPGPGAKIRLFAGVGINVVGAGVLLADLIRWLSI